MVQIGLQGSLSIHGRTAVNQGRQVGQGLPDQHRQDIDEFEDPVCVNILLHLL
jgi:hypothetical protein